MSLASALKPESNTETAALVGALGIVPFDQRPTELFATAALAHGAVFWTYGGTYSKDVPGPWAMFSALSGVYWHRVYNKEGSVNLRRAYVLVASFVLALNILHVAKNTYGLACDPAAQNEHGGTIGVISSGPGRLLYTAMGFALAQTELLRF